MTLASAAASGILRPLKGTRLPMIFTIIGYWAVGAPVGIWLSHEAALGAAELWIGLALGAGVTAALRLERLRRRWPAQTAF